MVRALYKTTESNSFTNVDKEHIQDLKSTLIFRDSNL